MRQAEDEARDEAIACTSRVHYVGRLYRPRTGRNITCRCTIVLHSGQRAETAFNNRQASIALNLHFTVLSAYLLCNKLNVEPRAAHTNACWFLSAAAWTDQRDQHRLQSKAHLIAPPATGPRPIGTLFFVRKRRQPFWHIRYLDLNRRIRPPVRRRF